MDTYFRNLPETLRENPLQIFTIHLYIKLSFIYIKMISRLHYE